MKIAYVRVSTAEQNEARQVEALKKHEIDRWFIEKISGKDMERPELQKMLDVVQPGDTVFIHDFSRLARSTKDLLELVERFQKAGVHLVSNKENLDTSTPTGKLMLTMIAAINEFERKNILDRQREGIAIAKAQGKYKGRKPIEFDEEQFRVLYNNWQNGKTTPKIMMNELGMKPSTFWRKVKEYREKYGITDAATSRKRK